MNTDSGKLTPAEIEWQEGSPVSVTFEDIYFNRAGGNEETEHVFINGNDLPQRWSSLDEDTRFTLAETGFGTGLNFLCARRFWLDKAPQSACLHYLSCEKHPMSAEDLRQALSAWPEFQDASDRLCDNWPAPVPGFYTLVFDQGRVRLTLLFGDAAEMLSRLDATVDAWFLDGFAPAKNPEMWSEQLFASIAARSRPGSTFATFTAAGLVKRGLAAVGFDIQKRAGFGRKRDMLTGRMSAPAQQASAKRPWLARATACESDRHAIVIGAGLAGCSTASALARRGWRVDLLERRSAPALEGSGNPQGALYLKLPLQPTAQSRLHLSGLHYSAAMIRELNTRHGEQVGDLCGVLSLALDPQESNRQERLLAQGLYPEALVQGVDSEQARVLSGMTTGAGGLYFPSAGWASPPRVCAALTDHPRIHFHYNTTVSELTQNEAGHWLVNGGQFQAPAVIICTANDVQIINSFAELPLKPIRGQTSTTAAPESVAELKTVVCGEGYISPPLGGHYCFGASFVINDAELAPRESEHRENMALLRRALPELGEAVDELNWTGRVAHRATTPDYLPIVGALHNEPWTKDHFAQLRHDAKWPFKPGMRHYKGLYINTGHGSKGLISCPISAEYIAALIEGSPLPLERTVVDAINPVRFLIKKLIKGSI
ncbi:MAG: bifunctional tRNA (5-methylaminomethyl-2-thiouridine)(34)-methyltransferase MnmD/FAD-dependent 5-carboxymethylaminomethyl-2-thiouridine(34) oxidoreductase MnmC [Oceanospirillaceae bacterium]|nr:bifunctional tRNA (5-methylaminomethyl-2-thiouridine)(34)-methyltransferase MnmD/FAD-dependent 5-carboxymethylaminomethyl-2-thiouridine(34) oxidoreductase MnmC [Oceanospirillaceae bacterium]